MPSPRLLLISNGKNYGGAYLEHARDAIASFLGKRVRSVLFVPYAGVTISWDDFAAKVGGCFEATGYHLSSAHGWSKPREAVGAAEAIVVGGGNSFHLLRALYEHDLLDAIRDRVRAGVPYIGWSAGANVACPTIRTTNDMPIVEPPSFDALGLIPFQINPHYTQATLPRYQGETRDDRLAEFVTANPSARIVALREGSMLEIEGQDITIRGGHQIRVFASGSAPRDLGPDDPLGFLFDIE